MATSSNDLILGASLTLTMSSREVAELVEATHDNVLKTVRTLIEKGLVSKNETPYTHPQNGQTYSEFLLNYRDTLIVVSGYSVEFRARVIDRWLDLERKAVVTFPTHSIPETLPQALRLAADLAEGKAIAESALALAAPKAAALDRLATETEGAVNLRVAAKLLQMPERQFLQFACTKRFIFRGVHGTWQGYADKAKSGLLELKLTTVRCIDGPDRRVEQVLFTRAGLAKLASLLERERNTVVAVKHA